MSTSLSYKEEEEKKTVICIIKLFLYTYFFHELSQGKMSQGKIFQVNILEICFKLVHCIIQRKNNNHLSVPKSVSVLIYS